MPSPRDTYHKAGTYCCHKLKLVCSKFAVHSSAMTVFVTMDFRAGGGFAEKLTKISKYSPKIC